MVRYFFNVGGPMPSTDDVGVELPSIEAALEEAVKLAGAIIADTPKAVGSFEPPLVEVTDGQQVVARVKVSAKHTLH